MTYEKNTGRWAFAGIGLRSVLLTVLVTMTPAAFAINGFFMPGYGPKSLAVGGTGVAMPQDRLAAAINPAGMALVEPGLDANLMFFHPQRTALLNCKGVGLCDRAVADRSNRELFEVPGFGYSRRWDDRTTLGISLYANGGMNTSYSRALYEEAAMRVAGRHPGDPGFPTEGKIGVDFMQLIIAPSAAYRVSSRWIVGIAPMLVVQKFSARGLGAFAGLSSDPTSMTNRGADYELGAGVRVGVIYLLRPDVRLGAQYSSPLFISRYTKYSGLFADDGRLNSPAHYTVGISWDATPRLTLGFDFQQILFGSIDAISNPGPTMAELGGAMVASRRFGGTKGIGFGWTNQKVYKIGAIYRYNEQITLRLGWNHGDSLVPNREALLAPLVPGVMRDHFGAGMSYRLRGGKEISLAYMHAFGASVETRQSPFFGMPAKAWAATDSLDLGFALNF